MVQPTQGSEQNLDSYVNVSGDVPKTQKVIKLKKRSGNQFRQGLSSIAGIGNAKEFS